MLKVKNLQVYYGMIHALRSVSLHVKEKEIVALIGANRAGKTTLLGRRLRRGRAASGEVVARREGDHEGAPRPDRPGRDRARSGGAAHLQAAVGRGQPAAGVVPPVLPGKRAAASGRRSTGSSPSSRYWPSGGSRWRGRSPAGSSRCWRSGGRSLLPEGAAAGRAVDGAGAQGREGDLRPHLDAAGGAGDDDPARRAERPGALAIADRATSWRREGWCCRGRRRTSWRTGTSSGLPGTRRED